VATSIDFMRRWFGAAALGAVIMTPATARAQDTKWNRYTLEDLGGVFVRVEVEEACQSFGVTPAAYEADVSMKLIESEVGVLTQMEMLEHPALPELRVSVTCSGASGEGDEPLAYAVELRVQQSAQMLRDTQITLPEAVTWFSSEVGVTTVAAAPGAVGETLMAELDGFITAWAEVHAEGASDG